MNAGITKTIPSKEGIAAIQALYNGNLVEYEFHMAGKPSKLNVGDYVYTIFNDMLYGRLKIKQLIEGYFHPESGKPRTLIMVECPGKLLKSPVPYKGHRGTRYYKGSFWEKDLSTDFHD